MVQPKVENRTTDVAGHAVWLAQPSELPERPIFSGLEDELRMCRVAWGLDKNYQFLPRKQSEIFAFRLYGEPGMGKNELVYELVRNIRAKNQYLRDIPFYSMVGHDEMSPEDMVLAVVPAESEDDDSQEGGDNSRLRMVLRASPLATAIIEGGIFFFDELNRLPERALAPLAPALDGRGMLFSASSGVWLEPNPDAKYPFRFCCALNPSAGGDLPGYIDQRTLPRIHVAYPGHREMVDLLEAQLQQDLKESQQERKSNNADSEAERNQLAQFLEKMRNRLEDSDVTPSVRQGLTVMRLAQALAQSDGEADSSDSFEKAWLHVFPPAANEQAAEKQATDDTSSSEE